MTDINQDAVKVDSKETPPVSEYGATDGPTHGNEMAQQEEKVRQERAVPHDDEPGVPNDDPAAASALADHLSNDATMNTAEDANATTGTSPQSRPKPRRHRQRQQTPSQLFADNRRLSVRDVNWQIPTNLAAQDLIEEEHGEDSWRFKTLKFLHSSKLQFLLMGLLLADIIILFTELFLLAQYPHCHIIERDAISCCSSSDKQDDAHRWLTGGDDGDHDHHDYCSTPDTAAAKDYNAGCDEHKWSKVHHAEEVLFAMTIAILVVFFVELNVEMVALKPQIFWRQFFFGMDYIIVTVSLVLELTFHFLDEATIQSLFGLLILARVWRFIRIGHGIVELTHEWAHHDYSHLLAYTEELEEMLMTRGVALPDHRPTLHHEEASDSDHDLLEAIERKRRLKYRASSSMQHA